MRKLITAGILAAATVGGAAAPVQAQVKQQEKIIIFYSDESESQIVGQNVFFCDGTFKHVGSYSIWSEEIDYSCS